MPFTLSIANIGQFESFNFKDRRFESPFYILCYIYLALSRCLFVRFSNPSRITQTPPRQIRFIFYIDLPLRLDNRKPVTKIIVELQKLTV